MVLQYVFQDVHRHLLVVLYTNLYFRTKLLFEKVSATCFSFKSFVQTIFSCLDVAVRQQVLHEFLYDRCSLHESFAIYGQN